MASVLTRDGGAARLRLAYILAPSHSGSTLLAMLLGSHPQVCSVGELSLSGIDDPRTYRCSCGVLLHDCPFWQRVSARITSRGISFDVLDARTDVRRAPSQLARRLLRPLHRTAVAEGLRDLALHLTPGWSGHLLATMDRNVALVSSLLHETGAAVVVDSSKIGIRLKYLLRCPAFDIRIIRLVRDGRAVALTYMDPAEFADATDPSLRGGGSGGSREHERLSIDAAALEWRRSHEEADALLASVPPEQWMQVQYEQLCADTDRTLDSLCAFLGVATGSRHAFREREHHVVGNGMRLDTSTSVVVDDRWRRVFDVSHHRAFESVAGALNRRFGYQP